MVIGRAGSEHRDRSIIGVAAVILVANVAVAAAKLLYGARLGSMVIQVDGFHSLLDGVNNVAIIVAMSIARRPPDASHPYGHRKFEVIASLFIGFMLTTLVVRTAIEAVGSLIRGESRVIEAEGYVVVIVTLVVNIVVALGEHVAGKRLDSEVLIADARHTLSDVLVSLTVLGGVYFSRHGLRQADAVSALLVLVVVSGAGYGILRRAIAGLADEVAITPALLRAEALLVTGVKRVDRIRSRRYGKDVKVDVVIAVDGTLSLREAHRIADAVETRVERRFAQVTDVLVHVEPT